MAYFPNGSAASVLEVQCADCPLGYGWNDPAQQELFDREPEPKCCPVHFVQLNFNYEQVDAGQEKLREAMTMLVDNSGTCQIRKRLVVCRESASSPR